MAKFAFVHIPKTAGRTFFSILFQHCSLRAALGHMLMQHYYTLDLDDYQIYGGHTFYMMLKDLMPPETKYLTLLRDPINRAYSHWKFIVEGKSYSRYGLEQEPTFSEFMRDKRTAMLASNFQCRYLGHTPMPMDLSMQQHAWQVAAEQEPLRISDEELLDTVLANLSTFLSVGTQERLRSSAMTACLTMGFLPPRDVETKQISYYDRISDEDLDFLYQHNKLDFAVYDLYK